LDFDATFDEQYPALVRYCQRMTGDYDLAEDVAQETLFRLFGSDVRGAPDGVRAWLFKTATHLLRDRWRVESNRRRLLELHPVGPREPEPPDRSLERAEAWDVATAALLTLLPRDREVLLMRYSGFSYREIAEALDMNPGSVGTTLARAERRFENAVRSAGEAA
jgi:RNA polymerase sigma-70 factor (ECF subfamily)